MYMTKKELEAKVEEIRKYKAMIEEASNIEKALEAEVISYMNENNLTEEITDTAKITYKSQTRATLDKKRLEEDLGSLEEYTKTTTYSVLRIKQQAVSNQQGRGWSNPPDILKNRSDLYMSKTRIISIKDLTCSTYSVKDNSDRGCHTACKSEIKVGDEVVIDNYFTLVTE